MSLPSPAPPWTPSLGAASTLTPATSCAMSPGTVPPPHLQCSAHTQWAHSILPSGPPSFVVSLSPTLASGLIHSVEQFPPLHARGFSGLIRLRGGLHAGPGSWCLEHLPGSSWEHSSATSPSLWWSLRQGAGLFSLRGLIPARAQVPRTGHTPGCQFGLHISAPPVPVPAPPTPSALGPF